MHVPACHAIVIVLYTQWRYDTSTAFPSEFRRRQTWPGVSSDYDYYDLPRRIAIPIFLSLKDMISGINAVHTTRPTFCVFSI
jgi:hypothetical protein